MAPVSCRSVPPPQPASNCLTHVAAAFVQLREGTSTTEAELVAHCAAAIATFKVPRYVRFVSQVVRS